MVERLVRPCRGARARLRMCVGVPYTQIIHPPSLRTRVSYTVVQVSTTGRWSYKLTMKRRSQKIITFFSAPAEPPAKRAAFDQGSMIQSTVTLSEVGSSSAASKAGSSSTAAESSSAASAGSLSEDGSLSTASVAGSSSTASSQVSGRRVDGFKHRTGYDSRWEGDHTWIFYVEGEGMYCKLCRKLTPKTGKTSQRSGIKNLARLYVWMHWLGTRLPLCTEKQ